MRVLNLFAGIGGNRRLWGEEHHIRAVEFDYNIAAVYSNLFPADDVVVDDALAYLVEHFAEFDFIWASPPCTTHSQYRYNVGVRAKGYKPVIPDMTSLYGIIVFLTHHYDGLWAVENVRPYYETIIVPSQKVGRHQVWANFDIAPLDVPATQIRSKNKISEMEEAMGFDLSKFNIPNKRQLLRNCVEGEVGLHILKAAEVHQRQTGERTDAHKSSIPKR
jgi:DNA (cytosine-5)-methyltransferase 1